MLRSDLQDALKEAMRAKDSSGVATIRLIMAALKDRDIAARSKGQMEGISDDEILQMLQSMIKQRRESIQMYEQGGRLELAEREKAEIEWISKFLPRQMTEDEAAAAVDSAIADLDASGLKDMGRVMAALRERHAGQMDFGKASGIVKQKLQAAG
ncbi:Transamidase GatB domain protein [Caenispirillum salinarum AK4]|uniref:Transamidase GatB domain protein n=1 Tax=Caenispirillum salinarum AK4 TaxID=1238182 RepID=K9GLU3_9PROT|nr:GatB/YqeY domain-containing protein [Caenispirillum salinarum]EKV26980.1 Transamidase GatB domain protein [Caenispirillum salinarum AK4]